jgi:hypothetical protein
MKLFPREFSELLSPEGLRILNGKAPHCGLFKQGKAYFASYPKLIRRDRVNDCMTLLDKHLYPHLTVEQRRIPAESMSEMKENYEERLNKTMHIKTAFFRRKHGRAYQAADRIGLLDLMRSESLFAFVETLTGLNLKRDSGFQATCYEQGDYAGPHNDHHPEDENLRDGFIDLHLMFSNTAVAHHYLVYEERGHFSKIVDINLRGGVSVYKLPFWHYTTPLAAKPGRESEARRWLLLGSYEIIKDETPIRGTANSSPYSTLPGSR